MRKKSVQRRSRKTLPPQRLGGVHKRDARYSARREPHRLTVRPWDKSLSWQAHRGRRTNDDSPLRSLRPRWTAFLRILLAILTLPWHASCPGCITQELTFPQFGSSGGS
jgi:hypothetical protein